MRILVNFWVTKLYESLIFNGSSALILRFFVQLVSTEYFYKITCPLLEFQSTKTWSKYIKLFPFLDKLKHCWFGQRFEIRWIGLISSLLYPESSLRFQSYSLQTEYDAGSGDNTSGTVSDFTQLSAPQKALFKPFLHNTWKQTLKSKSAEILSGSQFQIQCKLWNLQSPFCESSPEFNI